MAQEYVLMKTQNKKELGQIAVSKAVIERIVTISMDDVEGVMLQDRGFNRNPLTVKLDKGQLAIVLEVKIDYNRKVEEVCEKLQEKILQMIELMIGYHYALVDIKVVGFQFN